MYKEGVDFVFFDAENGITGICLNIPGYEDILYHYHRAKVIEEGEMARLTFGYTIVDSGKHDIDTLTTDEKFHTIMGDILTILLTEYNEQIRKNNPQEPDLQ